MQEKLTIAIPTYNRSEILLENLNRIFQDQIPDVEILVCDNCSPDNTQDVCKSFIEKFENFTYYRQKSNLGYDSNVISCVENSKGEYIWFLSDDDFINGELIKCILEIVSSNSIVGILINAIVRDPVSGIVIIENLGKSNEDKRLIVDDNTFIQYSKWSTLISSIVIKRENIDIQKCKEYVGTCFVQLAIFWLTVKNQSIFILGSQKLIKNDAKHADFGLNDSEIWVISWINVISSFKHIYSSKSCRKAAVSLYDPIWLKPGSLLTHVFMGKIRGSFTRDTIGILTNLELTKSYVILLKSIMYLNSSFLKFIYASAKALKNSKNL